MAARALTKEDVKRLIADPSVENREDTAAHLGQEFSAGTLRPAEKDLAVGIFEILAKDAAVRVRAALSRTLKASPDIPHSLAVRLAKDVEEVALPLIEVSEVLTDADLIDILKACGPAHQTTVAGRTGLSEAVSAAVIETDNDDAIGTLLANSTARISEASYEQVVGGIEQDDFIAAAMVRRPSLPLSITEKLLRVVSENLKTEIAVRHPLPEETTTDLILRSRDRALIEFTSTSPAADVERFVRELHENGRLTNSLIVRALCMGDIGFFEAALACRAKIALPSARKLIHDPGRLGVKAVHAKAQMPKYLLGTFVHALDVLDDMEYDGGENDRERYTKRLIARMMTFEEDDVAFAGADLEFLLAKLDQLSPAAHA